MRGDDQDGPSVGVTESLNISIEVYILFAVRNFLEFVRLGAKS